MVLYLGTRINEELLMTPPGSSHSSFLYSTGPMLFASALHVHIVNHAYGIMPSTEPPDMLCLVNCLTHRFTYGFEGLFD